MLEQPEKLEEWKCEKCDDKQVAMKQLVPYRFPPILVIHLKVKFWSLDCDFSIYDVINDFLKIMTS